MTINPSFKCDNTNDKRRKVWKYQKIRIWEGSSANRLGIYGTDVDVLDFDLYVSDKADNESRCPVSMLDWQAAGPDRKALCLVPNDTNNTYLNAKQKRLPPAQKILYKSVREKTNNDLSD